MSAGLVRTNAIVPLTPTADHTGLEGYAVKNSSGSAALVNGATDTPLGVIVEGSATTGQDSVALCAGGLAGTVRVKVNGNVAKHALLQIDANGKFITDAGTGSRVVCAQALEAGVADELIEAVLFKPLALA